MAIRNIVKTNIQGIDYVHRPFFRCSEYNGPNAIIHLGDTTMQFVDGATVLVQFVNDISDIPVINRLSFHNGQTIVGTFDIFDGYHITNNPFKGGNVYEFVFFQNGWRLIDGVSEFGGIIGESGSHTHTVTGNVTSDIEVTVNNEMFTVECSAGVLALNGLLSTGCEAGVLSLSRNSSSTVTGSVTSTLNEITTSEAGSHTHSFE